MGETQMMRTKEAAHDYRYFPEPDLLPIKTADLVAKMRDQVPELPHEKRQRFEENFGINAYDAGVLTSDQKLADYFEQAASQPKLGKKVANWITNSVLAKLNEASNALAKSKQVEIVKGLASRNTLVLQRSNGRVVVAQLAQHLFGVLTQERWQMAPRLLGRF